MKILFVGPLWYGTTTLQRAEALEALGYEVVCIDTEEEAIRKKKACLFNKAIRRLFGPLDIGSINKKIVDFIQKNKFDVLWIDKGLIIKLGTIRKFKNLYPNGKAVNYSPDDMMNPDNQSRQYLDSISEYDLHVTTKSYNVPELAGLGAKDIYFIEKSFCTKIHRPISLNNSERELFGGSVGFIGAYEKQRFESVKYLAKKGILVKVWGTWPRYRSFLGKVSGINIMNRSLWGDDYAKAICSFDINLAFLRKCNRDLQTARSIEIPACGGFMLAERTDEHLSLFKEGVEAEFFSNNDELLDKTRYYLKNPEKRKAIAQAGYERCIKDGYDNKSRLAKLFSYKFG